MVWSLVSICINSPHYGTLDYWSRDMLNFNFSEKGLWLVSPSHFVYDYSDQISFYDCRYFSKYWAICVLQLFTNQAVTSQNMKLALSVLSSRFITWPKSQDKNLNIYRTTRDFSVKWKVFFIIFKGLSVAKNCLRPESAPLRQPEFSYSAYEPFTKNKERIQ